MPKSSWGAKTCFTIGGKWYLINLGHLILIERPQYQSRMPLVAKKRYYVGKCGEKGWVPMFPHSPVINITQNVNIFVKTKNAQEALKHKINLQIFFLWHGCSHIGEWGGVWPRGKNSHVMSFLILKSSLSSVQSSHTPHSPMAGVPEGNAMVNKSIITYF